MRDSNDLLSDIVRSELSAASVAGVAIAAGRGAAPHVVWTPTALLAEPAFLAYSLTKTFTAALLLLSEAGRLRLDDCLARWFPRIAGADRITLRQLLNHTAGIPDYGGLRAYHAAVRAASDRPWSAARFAAETYATGLVFEPGTGWAYSNPGYMLLKQIAEAVGGASYAGLIAEHIVRPLGLRRTFVAETTADLAALAPATSSSLALDGTLRNVRLHYHPGWVSHGVIASTPFEIVRWMDALFGGRLIGAQSLQELTALVPVKLPDTALPSRPEPAQRWVEPSYGLGIMGDPASPCGVLWGHNGGGPGYSASAFHAPALGHITVCAMAALEGGSGTENAAFAAFERSAASERAAPRADATRPR